MAYCHADPSPSPSPSTIHRPRSRPRSCFRSHSRSRSISIYIQSQFSPNPFSSPTLSPNTHDATLCILPPAHLSPPNRPGAEIDLVLDGQDPSQFAVMARNVGSIVSVRAGGLL